ncbi:radical SAM protein with 4Fe4S-binding SPASM domain [Streptomyces sp. LBL]|uniref:radical SAM protein n=1 Tax=Streptomyces sp. LBL TaxID=2940562 RepID=UPI002473389B|nr:radical SAM protein [Streptomyces sp. LBL]MDH6624409.1 radical SAM protein with 4Fe4S-binding SPASM domain [Streptomyces sp. LBL]
MSSNQEKTARRRLPLITDHDLAPLKAAGVVDGHQAFPVGDHETLFSNEELITPLQPYPGAVLPRIAGRTAYPIPDRPGDYGTYTDFRKAPKYMAQWVHWKNRANMVLEGRYHELPPAHFEGIFTLVCNFMCPHCTRRVTRTKWVEDGTWEHNTEVEKKNTMHPAGLRRVIDQLALHRTDDQMGIVWGGGDPTANPYTYDGMMYARNLGITSSFLTNGTFLEVDRCLDADPTLIRISLNCGTEETYRKFHGYPRGWDYFDRVKANMRDLARRKLERGARTLVGISLITDERNMDDTVAAAKEIRAVVEEAGPGIDYVIARPVMNYEHFDDDWARVKDGTKQRALDLVSDGGEAWSIINDLGIPLVLIKDSYETPPAPETYEGTDCLAYGMYGELRHNGDVQLCSDSYGNPEYTVGNLFENTLEEIWRSDRRREVLDKVNAKKCFQTACPHNSRGHHHNRVFHQIEKLRQAGEIERVRRWMDDLREVTYPLGHSFFV